LFAAAALVTWSAQGALIVLSAADPVEHLGITMPPGPAATRVDVTGDFGEASLLCHVE